MIEYIKHNEKVHAIILRHNFDKNGVSFLTPENFSQQLAYMKHPTGKTIQPHFHRPVLREIFFTQEVLLIRRGKLRVDFYDDDQEYLESRILEAGDVILLATGGHGFEVLDEIEMIEVKQGPYAQDKDKIRFEGISSTEMKIINGEI